MRDEVAENFVSGTDPSVKKQRPQKAAPRAMDVSDELVEMDDDSDESGEDDED